MSGKLLKLNPLLAAIWLLAGSLGQTAKQPEFRTCTDSTGKYQVEAAFVDFQNGQLRLKKPDGQVVSLAIEKLSQADQQYIRQRPFRKATTAERKEGQTTKGAVQAGTDRAQSSVPDDAPGLAVVATGVGIDPEKAKQNAFANAIEQVVGVLVDAETIVRNDEIVRDEVRTFSRGKMQNFELIDSWQEDGLHYAHIRAKVAVNELTARLRQKRIVLAKFPGEHFYRQFLYDRDQSQNAAEMLARVMQDYALDRFVVAEVVGEPEVVERDNVKVKLRIHVRVSADMARWEVFRNELRRVLRGISQSSFLFTSERNPAGARGYHNLELALGKLDPISKFESGEAKDPGAWIIVSQGVEPDGHNTLRSSWQAFRLPAAVCPFLAELVEPEWQLRIQLLDQNGSSLAGTKCSMRENDWHAATRARSLLQNNWTNVDLYWLAPFPWSVTGSAGSYAPRFDSSDLEVEIAAEDLPELKNVAAFVEKVEEK